MGYLLAMGDRDRDKPAMTVLEVDFEGLRIRYDDRVLAPRAWTAAQARWAAELIETAPPGPVLELCAGAGHIGLLAVSLVPRVLVAVDSDPVACAFLRRNAADAGVRVDLREGPMDRVLTEDEQFAVVIADPPWVARDQVDRYPDDPVTAIDGGGDGLDLVRGCLDLIARHLAETGSAILQVGPDQVGAVEEVVEFHAQLCVVEVRTHERGALLRVDRRHS
jgi:release factor glutamine methyltransferase